VLDFGDATFLSTSFMGLVLRKPGEYLLPKISRVSFPESPNLNAMSDDCTARDELFIK
jgi:hypothetical protein